MSGVSNDQELLLVVGGQSDPNIVRMVDQLHLRGVNYFFWDTDQPQSRRIAWDYASSSLDLDEQTFVPTAVFLRHNMFHASTQSDSSVYDTLLGYLLVWPEVRVLNRKLLTDSNNKARNLMIARQVGLTIPRTIVVADSTGLINHPQPSSHIIKPLMGGGLARSLEQAAADAAELYSAPPQFVQERLSGDNLRVYVIGNDVFAFTLGSTQLDYREDPHVSVESTAISAELRQLIVCYVRQLGFDFCALDFRCRHEMQDPVFLEINSSPMFVRFDDACENQLVDTLWRSLQVERS